MRVEDLTKQIAEAKQLTQKSGDSFLVSKNKTNLKNLKLNQIFP
jgi:hypothetical protein